MNTNTQFTPSSNACDNFDIVIFAPHVDDEAIGCFSLLESGLVKEVRYFYDLTEARVREARMAGDRFGFQPTFGKPSLAEWYEHITPSRVLVLPSISDSHPDHKLVNRSYRNLVDEKHRAFYSVDLQTAKTKVVLPPDIRERKLACLRELYPSQDIWEADASYYLFENITHKDYQTLYTYRVWVADVGPGTVQTDIRNLGDITVASSTALVDLLVTRGAGMFRVILDNGVIYESWN